jgi:hypothetical protein
LVEGDIRCIEEAFAEGAYFVALYLAGEQHVFADCADCVLVLADGDWQSGGFVVLLFADEAVEMVLVGFYGWIFEFAFDLEFYFCEVLFPAQQFGLVLGLAQRFAEGLTYI